MSSNSTTSSSAPPANSSSETLLGLGLELPILIMILVAAVVFVVGGVGVCCVLRSRKAAAAAAAREKDAENAQRQTLNKKKHSKRHNSSRKSKKVSSLPVAEHTPIVFDPPPVDEVAFAHVENYALSKEARRNLRGVEKLLRDDAAFAIVDALVDTVQENYYELLSVGLASAFASMSGERLFELLCHLVSHEVDLSLTPELLFAENSLISQFFLSYSKIVATEYLWNTLGERLVNIVNNDERGEKQVVQAATGLFQNIVKSSKSIPPALKALVTHAVKEVSRKYGDEEAELIANSLYFERFYAPAVAHPNKVGILPVRPSKPAQIQLSLTAKLLKNLALGESFPKNKRNAAVLNSFVSENSARLARFQAEIAADATLLGGAIPHISMVVPHLVKLNALAAVHEVLCEYSVEVIEALPHYGDDASSQIRSIQRLMARIPEPISRS